MKKLNCIKNWNTKLIFYPKKNKKIQYQIGKSVPQYNYFFVREQNRVKYNGIERNEI
jgi:hypothetical protein